MCTKRVRLSKGRLKTSAAWIVLETTIKEHRKQMSVNINGTFFCTKYVGEVFKKQGWGNLIITSSVSVHIVIIPLDQPVYNTTKVAITHLGKFLARE